MFGEGGRGEESRRGEEGGRDSQEFLEDRVDGGVERRRGAGSQLREKLHRPHINQINSCNLVLREGRPPTRREL